jgi:hypothetical protein
MGRSITSTDSIEVAAVNGRSAAEVVSNLSLKLDGEIAAMEARKPGDVLGTVEVFSSSYYWRQSG